MMGESKSSLKKDVLASKGYKQALLHNLNEIIDSKEWRMEVSQNYLVFKSDESAVRIRHIDNKRDLLISYISTPTQQRTSYINKPELLEFLVELAQFDQIHWSTWKKFERLSSKHSSSANTIVTSKNLTDMFRAKIDSSKNKDASSIDVIVSKNQNQSIYLIFNNGLDNSLIRNYFINGFLSDKAIIHSCKLAEIKEIVFWDGITSASKRIRVDEIYLSRA